MWWHELSDAEGAFHGYDDGSWAETGGVVTKMSVKMLIRYMMTDEEGVALRACDQMILFREWDRPLIPTCRLWVTANTRALEPANSSSLSAVAIASYGLTVDSAGTLTFHSSHRTKTQILSASPARLIPSHRPAHYKGSSPSALPGGTGVGKWTLSCALQTRYKITHLIGNSSCATPSLGKVPRIDPRAAI